jgi:transcriptional regulator with XRE-family HTH domain
LTDSELSRTQAPFSIFPAETEMNELNALISRNLKLLRASRKMTQDKLAEAAGISKNYVAEIETGRKYPSPRIYLSLSKALSVPPYYLLFDDREQTHPPTPEPPEVAARRRELFIREVVRLVDDYHLPGESS